MRTIINTLSEMVGEAFAQCGYRPELGQVSESNRLDLCQFQCNGAFAAAKEFRKAPMVVAEEVAQRLQQADCFAKVEVAAPGFVNLVMTDAFLVEWARQIAQDAHLGIVQSENKQTVLIDYGGPNVAKPLHVGHFRTAVIGESIKRITKAAGHNVIADIHLGDWGLQIGLVITELKERNPQWKCFSDAFDPNADEVPALHVELLNEVYPFASKKSKENEAFAQQARQATYALQNRHPGYIALWKEMIRVSVEDAKKNYDILGVSFDYWYGESDADPYIPQMMEVLESKNLLRESDGAMVVDVAREDDKMPMPPVIVRKSDKSSIYATTDLATIVQRQKDFAPDKLWYVVDKRQSLYFTQIFRCAKLAGLVPAETEFAYIGFGTMNGTDGKPFKTRDGGVMKLEMLIQMVVNAAKEKLEESDYLDKDADKTEIAQKIGVAALKFGDLINHWSKDYVFDLNKFISFDGKTGSYLLYTITRINSILKKSGLEDSLDDLQVEKVYSDSEREVLLRIMMGSDVFAKALAEKAPSYLCEHVYLLANAFSKFYHDNRIIDEKDPEKKKSWIAMILLVKRVMEKYLDLLGIETVEHM